MLRRSLLLAWLVAILGILAPSIASAATTANLETRVKAFELIAATLVGRSTARTPEKHPEKSDAYDGIASGSPLAAESTAASTPGRLASATPGSGSFSPGGAAPGQMLSGIDPTTLQAGRPALMAGRLSVQRMLVRLGIIRNTPIQVTLGGVIWDGNHGVRAAIEAGQTIDVQLVDQAATGYGDVCGRGG